MAQDYNATINLPKTDFPMRAGLPKREPEMLARWKKIDIYGELLKKDEGKPRFSLHDGPPFSNGALHMGHALNKSIKDIIVRSYAMRGYYTPYIPGSFFETMLEDHPFLPKTSRLVLADYVTMDSGTGCVHTAPGFGADD